MIDNFETMTGVAERILLVAQAECKGLVDRLVFEGEAPNEPRVNRLNRSSVLREWIRDADVSDREVQVIADAMDKHPWGVFYEVWFLETGDSQLWMQTGQEAGDCIKLEVKK